MSENLNYATSYLSTLCNLWKGKLYFADLWESARGGRFRFNGAKSVSLPTITTTGRVDADRDTIETATRNYENAWEVKELTHHRKWSTLIHPLDIDQTDYAANISNITEAFNVNEKFPEMDAYMLSRLYTIYCNAGKTADSTALSASSVMGVFDSMMEKMNEAGVPYNGRILYVTPAVLTLLKNAELLTHTVEVGRGANDISRTVNSIDGVKVVMVPALLMKSAYTFTTGFTASDNAIQVQMLLLHPDAVIAPISYQFAQLDPPGAYTEGKYIYFEESCEDVFVISSKIDAIQFATGVIGSGDGDVDDGDVDDGGEDGGNGGDEDEDEG